MERFLEVLSRKAPHELLPEELQIPGVETVDYLALNDALMAAIGEKHNNRFTSMYSALSTVESGPGDYVSHAKSVKDRILKDTFAVEALPSGHSVVFNGSAIGAARLAFEFRAKVSVSATFLDGTRK